MSKLKFIFSRWTRLSRDSQAWDVCRYIDKRRAERVSAGASVLVYGHVGDEPFQERTETLNISGLGGLVQLSASVVPGQRLVLTNLGTDEDVTCRVARLVHTADGRTLAGLEFPEMIPQFWAQPASIKV